MAEVDLTKLSKDYTNYKWSFGEKAPKEDLEYLYVTCKCSIDEIINIIGGSSSGVGRWLKFYNINKPAPIVDAPELTEDILNKIDWSRLSRNFLEQPWKRTDKPVKSDFEYLYIELNLSLSDIAQIIGKSKSRVQYILRDLEISKPSDLHQQSRENMNLRKHGTKFPNASPEALKKKEQTNLKRFGVKSLLCKKELKEEGMLKKYGKAHPQQVESIREKTKETFNNHFGEDYYFQTKEFIEYNKQYNMEKYGVDNYAKTDEFKEYYKNYVHKTYGDEFTTVAQVPELKEKGKATSRERYGTDYPSQSKQVQQLICETTKKNHGVTSIFQKEGFREESNAKMLEKYGTTNANIIGRAKHLEDFNKDFWLANFVDHRSGRFEVAKCCAYHGIQSAAVRRSMKSMGITLLCKGDSQQEADIMGLLASWGVTNIKHQDHKTFYQKGGKTKELDVFIPPLKLAIEYDGLLFHSQGRTSCRKIPNKSIEHIQNKYKACVDKNIICLNIFENEWVTPHTYAIWKGILRSFVGANKVVDLNKCIVKEIDNEVAGIFMEENHIYGSIEPVYSIGLYFENTLVAVVQFDPYTKGKYTWELVRFAVHQNYSAPNALSELIKYFRKNISDESIITYMNPRFEDKCQYEGALMTKITLTAPIGYVYKLEQSNALKYFDLIPLSTFDEVYMSEEFPEYDSNKSIIDNLYDKNYRTIYDCGRVIYVLK